VIVVDTSAWVEWLHETGSPVHRTLGRMLLDGADLVITEVVAMELLADARGSREEKDLREGPLALPILTLEGPADYEAAADLYRACHAAGETLRGLTGCLVAVPAIRARATVLHANDDFDKLAQHSRLKIEPIAS
jgi:predicted nucleic acid-binding protein